MGKKSVEITITSAVVIAGAIAKPDSVHTVDETFAKDLLRRNKAVLTTGEAPGPDLNDYKVDELKELAAELDVEGAANMKKAELIEAIEKAQAE